MDALILVNRMSLVIENSTFENLSSKYGGAINFKGDYLSVKNSTFRNTHAITGGAILAKFFAVLSYLCKNTSTSFKSRMNCTNRSTEKYFSYALTNLIYVLICYIIKYKNIMYFKLGGFCFEDG